MRVSPAETGVSESPRPGILPPRAARAVLRREIWRRSRWWLILPACFTLFGVVVVVEGIGGTAGHDDLEGMDVLLRMFRLYVVITLVIPLSFGLARGLYPPLRRLPADPAAALQATLQLALGLGGVALAVLLSAEYLARPPMMQLSSAGPLLDRALGFLGLIFLLTCAVGSLRHTPATGLVAVMVMMNAINNDTMSRFRSLFAATVLRSDLQASIPTHGLWRTVPESLIWPLFIVAACALAYGIALRAQRSEPVNARLRGGDSFGEVLRGTRAGNPWWRLDVILAGALLVILFYPLLAPIDVDSLAPRVWLSNAVIFAILFLIFGSIVRWDRRDPLLSRLPARPARVAARRLLRSHLWLGLFAALPAVAEHVLPRPGDGAWVFLPVRWPPDLESAGGFLTFASSSLLLLLALLGRFTLGSPNGSLLGLLAGLMIGLPLLFFVGLWVRASAATLGFTVLALTLPAAYVLIRKRLTPDASLHQGG